MKKPFLPIISAGVIPALLWGQDPSENSPAPVPPTLPLTKLVIEPEDILDSKTATIGDRQVTTQRVSPITLPPLPEPTPPPDPLSPEIQQRLQELGEEHRETTMVFIGATVIQSAGFPDGPRTQVQVWDQGTKTSFKLWSSANWALFAGLSTVQGTDGRSYALIMSHSEMDIDKWTQFMVAQDPEYVPPTIPAIPPGDPTFVVSEGMPSPEALAPITALHQLYKTDHARLQAEHQAREQAQRDQEALLRDNPPQPKNIVIRHWRMDEAGLQGATPKPAVTR